MSDKSSVSDERKYSASEVSFPDIGKLQACGFGIII